MSKSYKHLFVGDLVLCNWKIHKESNQESKMIWEMIVFIYIHACMQPFRSLWANYGTFYKLCNWGTAANI